MKEQGLGVVALEGDCVDGRAGNLYYLVLYRKTVLVPALEHEEVPDKPVDSTQAHAIFFLYTVMQIQQEALGSRVLTHVSVRGLTMSACRNTSAFVYSIWQ